MAADTPGESIAELFRGMVRDGLARRQWSQAQLAQAADVSEKHLSQLLNGRTLGSLPVWERLLNALNGEDEENNQ